MAETTCLVENCGVAATARGWCRKHYLRWYKHGDPTVTLLKRDRSPSCAVEGCDKPLHGSTWCQMHYKRIQTHGDALYERPKGRGRATPRPRQTLTERFGARVDRRGVDECWPWLGGFDGRGYGIMWREGRRVKAHRLALELATGESGEGLYCLHSCDNPVCVNPAHLRWGTPADNTRDAVSRDRFRQATFCPHGHPWADNTQWGTTSGGGSYRRCKSCRRERRS